MPYHLAMSPRKFVLERETGFEPATSTLARLHSTTELLPRGVKKLIGDSRRCVNRKSGGKRKFFPQARKYGVEMILRQQFCFTQVLDHEFSSDAYVSAFGQNMEALRFGENQGLRERCWAHCLSDSRRLRRSSVELQRPAACLP